MDERNIYFEFRGFRVDPVRRVLYGADGQPIQLQPKAFNTLLFLIQRPRELVDKRSLLKAVWPHVIVDENNLFQVISQLRRVLGEHPEDHQFILTEPGRGYRFIAPVKRVFKDDPPVEPSGRQDNQYSAVPGDIRAAGRTAFPARRTTTRNRRRTRLPLLMTAAVPVLMLLATLVFFATGQRKSPSVAVLPFENLSTESEDAMLVAALHDDILTQLAKISGLKVIARASVMHYQQPDRNLHEIGEQLGTATVLEGTVRQAAGIIRMNIRLVDSQSLELLWTDRYELEPTNLEEIFTVQSDITRNVAATLDVNLMPSELAQLARQPTMSSKAYEFFLSGQKYAKGSDLLRDLPAAVHQLERAVEEDPNFALALAHLSIQNIHMYWTMDRSETRRELAASAVRRAIELQPDLPEAHLALAWLHYQGYLDYDAALRELAIAERGLPGDVELLFTRAVIYMRMGKLNEARTSYEGAVELDPRNPFLLRQYASSLTRMREYALAERHLIRVLEIAPDAVEAKIQLASIPWFRDGDPGPYLRAIRDNPLLRPGETLLGEWHVTILARDYEKALSILGESDEEVVADSRLMYKPLASLYGITYDLAGRSELAIEQFELASAHLETVLADRPEGPVMLSLAEALAGLGQYESATHLALQAIEKTQAVGGVTDAAECRIDAVIRVLAKAGPVQMAIEQLDAYLAGPGFWSIEGLLADPRLDPLRDEPRFTQLVEKYRRR